MLMTEDEIKATVSAAFKRGLVVEPAGSAALAAILTGKVWKGKLKLDPNHTNINAVYIDYDFIS